MWRMMDTVLAWMRVVYARAKHAILTLQPRTYVYDKHECVRRHGGPESRGGENRATAEGDVHHAARQTSSHAIAHRTLASSQKLYEAYNAPRNDLLASPELPRKSSGDA